MSAFVLVNKVRRNLPGWAMVVALLAGPVMVAKGQQPPKSATGATQPANAAKSTVRKTDLAVKPVVAVDPSANATRIAELRSQIDSEEKQLGDLKKQLADQALPESKFSKAEAKFKAIDGKLKELKSKLGDLQSREQPDVEMVAEVQNELIETETTRGSALKAFELEIVDNKTLQEKILTIEKKIAADKATLERLSKPAESTAATGNSTGSSAGKKPGEKESVNSSEKREQVKAESKPTEPAKKPENNVASLVASTATGGLLGKKPVSDENTKEKKSETDSELASVNKSEANDSKLARRVQDQISKFQGDIEEFNRQLETARQDEQMAAELVANLDKQVTLEAQLRDNARKKADMLNEQVSKLQDEFREKSLAEKTPQDELQKLADRMLEIQKEFQAAREESRLHSNRLQDIQNERSKQQETLRTAREKTLMIEKEIAQAETEIARLRDPTSLINILEWLSTRGTRIIMILLIMFGSRATLRSLGSRTIRMMVQGQAKTPTEDQNDRAETLVSVYSNAVSVSVIGGGLLLIAQEAGVPIGPLLGGAAIFGVAIAFGAQSLVKDYFSGFVILLENQFSVNDVIQVGAITGVVERITLRMTVVRDVAGTVHFMPNGTMTMVSNYSYDWARAVFEVPVSYKANIDEVIQDILAEGKKLRQDREFGHLCLDDLTMLGVDALNETNVLIKFYIKTKPLKQWPVKRELLRRIKNRLDTKGIESLSTNKAQFGGALRADAGDDHSSSGPNLARSLKEARVDRDMSI